MFMKSIQSLCLIQSILMKTDLSNATFIIPIRIESDDRLRNVVTSIAFLVENFDTNIIVKEVDKESVFQTEVLPIFEEILEVDLWKNFHHIFERSEEPLFHRLLRLLYQKSLKRGLRSNCFIVFLRLLYRKSL